MQVSASRRGGGVYDVSVPSRAAVTAEAGAYDRPGQASGPSPVELLLAALVSCAGSTFETVLERMRFGLSGLNVAADARRSEQVPRVFTEVVLVFHVASDAPTDRLLRAIEVTERTCSVSVTVGASVPIETRLVEVREVEAALTREVRRTVLRPHQTVDELAAEEHPQATWFAAIADGTVVGTASVEPDPPLDGRRPFRLRAMATTPEVRGRGLGRVLLDATMDHVRRAGGDMIWCSARVAAIDFYRRAGFAEISEPFDVPPIGPHIRMARRL